MLAERIHFYLFALFLLAIGGLSCNHTDTTEPDKQNEKKSATKQVWTGLPAHQIPYNQHEEGKAIWYGYELIVNTAFYLGKKRRSG